MAKRSKLEWNNNDNFTIAENKTLGTVVGMLKELDYSDNKHWFAESDYVILKDITSISNKV